MDGALQPKSANMWKSAMSNRSPRGPVPGTPVVLMVGAGGPERLQLTALFEDGGFVVREARDAGTAEGALASASVDLIVLEGRVGDGGALAVCARLARASVAPVVILSDTADPAERIIALEVGADEFMAHPVERRELIARARALVRRTRRVLQHGAPPAGRPWTLDLAARRFSGPDGRWVTLTPSEISLLQLFFDHPGLPITAASAAKMLGSPPLWTVESFRTLIVRLRRRLMDSGCPETVIRTVYGSGYVFENEISGAGIVDAA